MGCHSFVSVKIIIIVLSMMPFGVFVKGQTANILYTGSANYRHEKLKFGCSPSDDGWTGLTRVTLSKNISISTSLQEIVRVELDTGGILIQNRTTWGTMNYQSRAQMIKQYVNPLAGAGIEFDIPAELVQRSDEGLYHCEVDGTSSTGPIKRTRTGAVFLQDKTSYDSETLKKNVNPVNNDCENKAVIAVSALVGVLLGGFVVFLVMYSCDKALGKCGNDDQNSFYTSIDRNGMTQHVYNQAETDTQSSYYTDVK